MLSAALYTTQQVRELDRVAIEDHGIPGLALMKLAGKALFRELLRRWPNTSKLLACCGGGNNGGDGYIAAGLACQHGLAATAVALTEPSKLEGDAKGAYDWALSQGVVICHSFSDLKLGDFHVIIDAMLGTGLSGDVREDYAKAIAVINSMVVSVIAADIPSGICGNTGTVLGCAVRADATVSFIGLKQGLFTGAAPDYVGDVIFNDLQVPAAIYASVSTQVERINYQRVKGVLKPRAKDSHKGRFGHVLVIGGDHGMGGAVAMTAEAALRTGAGMVTVATHAEHIPHILCRTPEVMVRAVKTGDQLEELLNKASVVVIGPGLGRSPWSQQMLWFASQSDKPMVLDADALNLLSSGDILVGSGVVAKAKRNNWVLTPHPGEASRLLGDSITQIQQDRFQAAAALREKYGGSVVLKGSGSIIASNIEAVEAETKTEEGLTRWSVCTDGNPGMATAGMGDVLSGVIGALMAQGLNVDEAAKIGVCVHSAAADVIASKRGERGLMATDVINKLPRMVNPVLNNR